MARRAEQPSPARRRQRGAALIALLAVIIMGSAWMLTNRLSEGSASFTAQQRARSADALNRAKLALIGYLAAQSSRAGEGNPGALPCPEDGSYFGNASTEGIAATSCTLPAIGRFPWRTFGTDKLVDFAGEPLWYAVSTGWANTGSGNTLINSNSTGQLNVDAVSNAAVALVIAPGPALSVESSTGCQAAAQARPTSGTPNAANYLECENATGASTSSFVTKRTSGTFNDQAVTITVADVMPAIEAGIAARIEREIAPLITGVYSANSSWGNLTTLLPMGVSFSTPSTDANAYAGTPSFQGLLPLSRAYESAGSTTACTATAAPNFCEPNFVSWTGTPAATVAVSGLIINSNTANSCSVTSTTVSCTAYGWYWNGSPPSATVTIAATAGNVGATLRAFNTGVTMSGIDTAGRSASATFNSSAAARVTLTGTTPSSNGTTVGLTSCESWLSGFESWFDCWRYSFSVPISLLADHANVHTLLDSTNTTTGWFVRNQWHLLSYYAIASAVGPGGGGTCTTNTNCLTVTYHANSGKQRGILLLAGRTVSGQDRTSSALSNWLEGANADGVSPFETRSATLRTNRTFTDRVAVLSSN